MKYPKRETLERKKATLAAELAAIDKNLHTLNDEVATAQAKRAKIDAEVRGRVLDRLMQKRHEANPALAEAELRELSKILVNSKERKAFGLGPLPMGGPEHGAGTTH